jgi:hypothetical protein
VKTALKLGDFGLTRITGGVGLAIRLGQWAYDGTFRDLEHAFVYVGDGHVVEAMPGGAQFNLLSEYSDREILWSSGKLRDWTDEDKQRAAIVSAAKGYIGVPYSFLDYGAMVAHRLHLPAPGLKRYIASSKHMICSQIVDQCYLDAGYRLFTNNRWPGYVAPSSLYELLESIE